MTNEAKPIAGHCLCGAVSVKIAPSEAHVDACHCAMCRRWGSGPFLSTRMVTDPEISGGEHITRYASSDWADRGFCAKCGSNLFYYLKPRKGYSFAMGLFDDTAGYTLTEEIFIDEKPEYYDFTGDAERLTGRQVIAKFTADG